MVFKRTAICQRKQNKSYLVPEGEICPSPLLGGWQLHHTGCQRHHYTTETVIKHFYNLSFPQKPTLCIFFEQILETKLHLSLLQFHFRFQTINCIIELNTMSWKATYIKVIWSLFFLSCIKWWLNKRNTNKSVEFCRDDDKIHWEI